MAKKLNLFLLLIFKCLLSAAIADNACPYPCLPPPIPGTTTPATPATQTGTYSPPDYYPTPEGNFPNYPPPGGNYPNYPPGGGGDYGGVTMPPPPDPILPYFPYYYRNGVHRPSDQISSASLLPRSTAWIALAVAVAVFPTTLFWVTI